MDIPPQQGIQHRRDGHADQDANELEQSAAHGDGGEYPDGGQADGGAHHPGVDDVALELLEAEEEDEEDEGPHGGDHNQQNGGQRPAHEGAHHGDEGGHADDDAD